MANGLPPQRPKPQPHHYGETPEYAPPPQPQFVGMSNDVASKVVDAYKVNPMLTGLLLLNLLIFCGAGWYLNVVQERTASYVKQRDGDLKELQNKALDMAAKCIVPDNMTPRYAPQPQPYPQYNYAPPPPQSPPPQPEPHAVVPASPARPQPR